MIVVFPDSNALLADPQLAGRDGARLRDQVQSAKCELRIARIVISEVARRLTNAAREDRSRVDSALRNVRNRADIRFQVIEAGTFDLSGLWDYLSAAEASVSKWLRVLSGEWPGYGLIETPPIGVSALVSRDLASTRPFLRKQGAQTVGHLDTLIWLTAVEYLKSQSDAMLIFVTADKGFLPDQGGGLHPHLEKDLVDAGIEPGRVFHALTLGAAADHVELLNNDLTPEDALIRQALRGAIEEFHNPQVYAWGYDERPDRWAPDPYPVDLPLILRNVRLVAASFEGNQVVAASAEDEDDYHAEFDVWLEFTGEFDIDEWPAEVSSDSIEGIEGDVVRCRISRRARTRQALQRSEQPDGSYEYFAYDRGVFPLGSD